MITETWLHSDVQNSEIVPPSYTLIRRDRGSRGGGVAIAIKNNVKFTRLNDISDHESIWCKLKFFGKTILLGGVYRPPNAPPEYLDALYDYLLQNTNSRSNILVTGDFNLPGINWCNLSHDGKDVKSAESLLQTAFTFSLTQLVSDATRISSSSLLDLVFASGSLPDCSVSVRDGISDHQLIVLECPITSLRSYVKPSDTLVRDYTHADDEGVIGYMESLFPSFIELNDVNELWSKFKDIVIHCENTYVPLKKKRINREYPWMDRNLIHMKRKIKRVRKRGDREVLPSLVRTFQDKVRAARDQFFSCTLTSFMSEQPRKFWRYLSKDKSGITEIRTSGISIDNPFTIANEFNAFFQSVFTLKASHAHLQPYMLRTSMSEVNLSKNGIFNLLRNLDIKKSPGPDNISNVFLNRYAIWVAEYLYIIYKKSLESCMIPDDWRSARIVPIHKSGSPLELNNYRPVSLTSTACKLLEHILFKAIMTHLEDNNLLHANQHGFRAGLSTITQLAEITDDFLSVVNMRGQIDAVFLDFSKAFDVVPHADLVTKLHSMGIEPNIIRWIACYLSSRKQYVAVNDCVSDTLDVHSGVPQGSVLGPLMFLVYINDIYLSVHSPVKIRLFADDCVVYANVTDHSDQVRLNDTLHSISVWCETWGLKLNTSKTACITFSNKKEPLEFSYTINTAYIKKTNQVKYLGVTITNSLTWETHIENVCSNALKKLAFLKRKLRRTSSTVKLTAYKTLVRPKLEYADLIWSPHQKYLIGKLERVQNLALRFIYTTYSRFSSVSVLRDRAKLKKLAHRRNVSRMKFLYQLYHGHYKIPRESYLTEPPMRSGRTNHNKTVKQPFSNLKIHQHSLFPHAISLWNKLPEEVVNANTTESFVQFLNNLSFDM